MIRMRAEEVLDNFNTAHIYMIINSNPGIRQHHIKQKTGFGNGTLGNALKNLERFGYVVSLRRPAVGQFRQTAIQYYTGDYYRVHRQEIEPPYNSFKMRYKPRASATA